MSSVTGAGPGAEPVVLATTDVASRVLLQISAAWIASASEIALPRPEMLTKNVPGEPRSRRLCRVPISKPASSSFVITGPTSVSVSTSSPVTQAPSCTGLNATQPASARLGLSVTPSIVTLRSVRGSS